MFRKYSVDGTQQLKSSVQRGIRAKISDQYPDLDDVLDDLIPKKSTMVLGKCENKVSVVLVDDDPDEHFLFQADLEDAGIAFEFNGFTRTDAALDHLRAREASPVLVLTDLSLAGSDAIEFIAETRDWLHGGAVGVYSGACNPDTEKRCRDAGSSFFMVKPVSREKLETAIGPTGAFRLVTNGDDRIHLVAA